MQKVNFYMSNENKNGFSKSLINFWGLVSVKLICNTMLVVLFMGCDLVDAVFSNELRCRSEMEWVYFHPSNFPSTHPHLHAPSFACITQIICIVKVHTQTFKSLSINTNTIFINHKLRFKCRLFERCPL